MPGIKPFVIAFPQTGVGEIVEGVGCSWPPTPIVADSRVDGRHDGRGQPQYRPSEGAARLGGNRPSGGG